MNELCPNRIRTVAELGTPQSRCDRRRFLTTSTACLASAFTNESFGRMLQPQRQNAEPPGPTEFQIGCMTLPYARFSFQRAIQGIAKAGYQFVSLGTTHVESGSEKTPIISTRASLTHAKTQSQRCRDLGLEPLMMFSMIYPEKPDGLKILTHRLKQASAARIPQVLTFGHTEGGRRDVWIKIFRQLGPIARDLNVTLVVKQHGGSTGTGAACAAIVREVDDPGIMVNYDAGNVMDYLNLDPIPDIRKCVDVVRSFCIKDHRNWPLDQDCGPGLGEIDHFRLLSPVARLGITMPLCCENIFAPIVPRPVDPDLIDSLARRAREFLEIVTSGLGHI